MITPEEWRVLRIFIGEMVGDEWAEWELDHIGPPPVKTILSFLEEECVEIETGIKSDLDENDLRAEILRIYTYLKTLTFAIKDSIGKVSDADQEEAALWHSITAALKPDEKVSTS